MNAFMKRQAQTRHRAMMGLSKEELIKRLDEMDDAWLTATCHHEGEIKLYMDGDQWCAVRAECFTNIQECNAGFGDTPNDAVEALALTEGK